MKIRKNIEHAILIGLVCAIMMSMAHFEAACSDLKSSVLRLHIPANSDSEEDQAVKLAVRDRILQHTDTVFSQSEDLESAIISAEQSIEEIQAVANSVLREYGCDYTASVSIGTAYFETREYDDFVLPAGEYRSLIVRLGKAQGKNWWCVVFPAVCLPAADGNLNDSASDESSKIAENAPRYVMKFKVVEWYERIKRHFE